MNSPVLHRRDFLRGTLASAGGLIVALHWPAHAVGADAPAPASFAPNAFIRIAPDGAVTLVVSMAEMGQGVRTALPMILAEELDADWSRVLVEQAPVDPKYNHPLFHMQGTGGSSSVRAFYTPLRIAGASARAMLVEAAAHRWGVAPGDCSTETGVVIGPSGQRLPYGDLVAEAAALTPPASPSLKPESQFRLIGHDIARTDTRSKVRGAALFGLDVDYPGLKTAVVARPPSLGARLVSFDAKACKAIKGVHDAVAISSGIAVVADNFYAASKGRDALHVVWDESAGSTVSSETIHAEMTQLLDATESRVARESGTITEGRGPRLESVYAAPYLAHACMEPMNATAYVQADRCEIHAPTQAPGVNRAVIAGVLGLKPEQVDVHQTFLGGGFGRRFCPDFVMAAVETSKLTGKPIKVVYTREDDMRGQYYRPAALARLSASLDDQGHPQSFVARAVCASITRASGMGKADDVDAQAVEGLASWPYRTPGLRVEWSEYRNGPGVWFWRSVGCSQNTFFTESFVDELAHAAQQDPYAYRRALLIEQPRLLAVLDLAAQKAGWGQPLPKGHARGIAVAESFSSYVAEVVEVSLADDGTPRLHKVVAAVDCGKIVNPAIVRRQVQSAVIYGLSAALYGEITLKAGRVEQGNFDSYPIVRMPAAPTIEVHLVESHEAPTGIGEPGTPPLAPALANALFALTGRRVRELPLQRAFEHTPA